MELSEKGVVGRYRKQIPEMFAWKVFTSKINFRNICSTSVCICLPSDFSRSFVNAEFCVHLYALREFECKNLQGFWILLGFLNFLFHYLIIDTCSRENSWKIKVCHHCTIVIANFQNILEIFDHLFYFMIVFSFFIKGWKIIFLSFFFFLRHMERITVSHMKVIFEKFIFFILLWFSTPHTIIIACTLSVICKVFKKLT